MSGRELLYLLDYHWYNIADGTRLDMKYFNYLGEILIKPKTQHLY